MITITTANNETTLENDKAFCAYRIETEIDFDEDGYEVDGEQYVLIEKLFVPSENRGNGIARRLLREAVSHARATYPGMAIRLVAEPLDADTDMDRLLAFYESEGFDVIEAGEIVVMEH